MDSMLLNSTENNYLDRMNDDEHIGMRCKICNRRDYLPFECQDCHRYYCLEHWKKHPDCPGEARRELEPITEAVFCPACGTDLLNRADSELNALMIKHLRSGKCSLPLPPSGLLPPTAPA